MSIVPAGFNFTTAQVAQKDEAMIDRFKILFTTAQVAQKFSTKPIDNILRLHHRIGGLENLQHR